MRERLKHEPSDKYSWHDCVDSSDLVALNPKEDEMKVVLTINNKRRVTEAGRYLFEVIQHHPLTVMKAIDLGEMPFYDLHHDGVIKVCKEDRFKRGYPLDHLIYRVLARHPDEVPVEFAEDKHLLPEYLRYVQHFRDKSSNKIFDEPILCVDPLTEVSIPILRPFALANTLVSNIYTSTFHEPRGHLIGALIKE